MKAYVLGCSHAAGSEIGKETGLIFGTVTQAEEYGYLKSYPAKIAQALGYEVENHAIPGGSNDAIYRVFCSLPITPSDIVLVCWTGLDRTELYYEQEDRWLQISHGQANTHKVAKTDVIKQGMNLADEINDASEYQRYAKQWLLYEVNNWRGQLNKSKNIEALNARAVKLGLRVLNFDSFAALPPDWYHDMGHWPVDTTFCSWCELKQKPRTNWGHYYESAHREFAEYCLNSIDTKRI